MQKIHSISYNGVDAFKFIAAVLVILLHANPFGLDTFHGVILREVITPVAVPYFFCVSGFFWYRSFIEKGQQSGKHRIVYTLKLYCYWSIIYFPFVVVSWFINGGISFHNLLLYVRNFIFEGSFQTIWYLNALWSSFLIIYVLLKFFKPKQILCLSVPFYVLSCLLSSWNGLFVEVPLGDEITQIYYTIFDTTKNGLLDGFLFVALGMVICDIKNKETRPEISRNKMYIKGMICSFLIIIAEYIVRTELYGKGRGCDIVLGTIPFTLFTVLLSLNLRPRDSGVYKKLRVYSTLLFLTQRIPLTLFAWADAFTNKIWGITIFSRYAPVYFVFVLVCSFLISFIILKLSTKVKVLSKLF